MTLIVRRKQPWLRFLHDWWSRYFTVLLEPLWEFQDYGDDCVSVDETDVVMQVWKNQVIAFNKAQFLPIRKLVPKGTIYCIGSNDHIHLTHSTYMLNIITLGHKPD